MELRPHHILCIQKFTGHGYDAEFTRHMTAVTGALAEDRETDITLARGCDELCRMCPNNADGVCTSLEKVERMDTGVLDACGLSYGENARWTELAEKARKLVFETKEFNNICSCCQWFELCRRTEVKNG